MPPSPTTTSRICTSSSLRTQQTAEYVKRGIPDAELDVREALYQASAGALATAMDEAAAEVDALVIVAHNPGISALARELAGESVSVLMPGDILAGTLATTGGSLGFSLREHSHATPESRRSLLA